MEYRTESDSLGELKIPANSYHGIFTERVLGNFKITDQRIPHLFLKNYVIIKKIYAEVNFTSKKLSRKNLSLIRMAIAKIFSLEKKEFIALFPIDIIQSGGGTSTNMMINEVISNFANSKKGTYFPIHPNDQVNMSQSSNDTFPGVVKITTYQQLGCLILELGRLIESLDKKIKKIKNIKKVGRTHLQDALSINFSDEFSAFAETIAKNIAHIKGVQKLMLVLPFGATAVGSLQNITPEIRIALIKKLSTEFKIKFKKPNSYFESVSTSSDFQKVSSSISNLSGDLIKISNDLRLLASGPRAGIAEINLPMVQAGSSIMPGKVNPSILEALNMICFKTKGIATTIEYTTISAQLQLQAFMPIIGYSLYEMVEIITNGIRMFRKNCLNEISVNQQTTAKNLENSYVYATGYSEKLGYAKVSELVKKSYDEGELLRELLDKELSQIKTLK